MSLKRRRWSNELVDSLIDFQSRESSQLMDSLENDKSKSNDSLDHCSEVTSMIMQLNLQDQKITNDKLERSQSPRDDLNTSMIEDRTVYKRNSSTTPTGHDVNTSSTSLDANKQLFNFNERLSENITGSSDSETIKMSCSSDNLNERIETNMTSDSGTIKATSCNSSFQNSKEIKSQNHSACDKANNTKEGNFKQKFFSSPVIVNKDADLISDIDEPDVWETLMALEQVLSPFDDQIPISQEELQDRPHILSRLSKQYKRTPTRFTEKLVSIIEDSVVSLESPTKAADHSGISLHRMTGEFRKLCKFIEDESMPDWAPSLINMTEVQTPPEEKKIENTPKTAINQTKNASDSPIFRFTPKDFRCFETPSKNTEPKNVTPIRNFTPSADKSFEYWEEVCNMMYENQNSGKKKPVKRFSILKSVKSNMDDMLTRCERQLASLDETVDARCSEPCKKSVNDLQPNVATPRSKSVSKLFLNANDEKQSSITKNEEENISKKQNLNTASNPSNKIDCSGENNTLEYEDRFVKIRKQNSDLIQLADDSETTIEVKETNISNDEDDYQLSTNKVFRRNLDVSIEGYNTSLYSPASMQAGSHIFDDNDADCSLLIELAKRRQRCLDTAKLMMEIDREDPMTTNDDTRCVETLYKLGIQDKTFADVEDDVKFLNTLNHCFEYKKYFSDKSKPIVNMLSTIDSPEVLKSRTSSMLRPKPTLSRPQSTTKTANKASVYSTSTLNTKRTLKSVQDRVATPRVVPSTLPKATPRSERKISQTNKLQPAKLTPRVSSRKLSPVSLYTPRSTRRLSPTVNSHSQLRRTPSVKATAQSNKTGLLSQPKKLGVARTSSAKTSLNRRASKPTIEAKVKPTTEAKVKPTIEAKVKPSVKTQLRRTPSVEIPKVMKLRAGSASKPPAKTPLSRQQSESNLRCDRLTAEMARSTEKVIPNSTTSSKKKFTPEQSKSTENLVERPVSLTPESVADIFSEISPEFRKAPPKPKLFLTPGKKPTVAVLGRKKPPTYFSDVASKKIAPQKVTYDNVKSPIGMYVHSTDAELIQNIQGRINDRLLTPVTNAPSTAGSQTPKLKFQLSSKENKSPMVNCDENMVLPPVRYGPAKKVCLTEGKSPFGSPANSKTRKLLEPVENTVVIRHEGRVIQYNPNCSNAEMSIRVQKVADKVSSMKKKLV